ncbi:right-handed parallel beta-helix repeat-containing protein [Halogranum rubrum]|uniref:Right handed beta helix domain-containing protein n=1 Tax=Halogranum salarium B-1 TaxID=1210908 RepID=J3JD58_9EURY|nr:right-handed parallel beta-helix repeat-containing protein [Halogranum salarium]EJN57201.1 hypothetical protein HSB1_45870 [Halogranum salarium B-1]
MTDTQSPDGGQIDRRTFLGAAGAAALLGSFTGRARATPDATTALGDGDVVESFAGIANFGGKLVVGRGGYRTIQEAWDDAESGDVVYVHSSYDAQEVGEAFPIVLDYEEKEVTLTGGHPSGSVIDAGDVDENVVEVLGRGMNDYRNNPLVQNLKLVGGNIGLRIRAAPYSTYKDILVYQTKSHGISVEPYTDERGDFKGTFGVTFRNVVVWGCGGTGFRLDTDARSHSTSFFGCDSLLNGGYGVQLRGYSCRWVGGTIQNNGDCGVDARSGCGQLVSGVYFEGNGTAMSSPIEIYVAESGPGFTCDTCYFQGHYARNFDNGLDDGVFGIFVDGAPHASISNCTYRNFDECFLFVRDARDVDVHAPSHCPLDGTTFLGEDDCERLRSDGVVQESDLRYVEGVFRGDMGIHDGEGGFLWGPAIWNGREWLSVMRPEVIA